MLIDDIIIDIVQILCGDCLDIKHVFRLAGLGKPDIFLITEKGPLQDMVMLGPGYLWITAFKELVKQFFQGSLILLAALGPTFLAGIVILKGLLQPALLYLPSVVVFRIGFTDIGPQFLDLIIYLLPVLIGAYYPLLYPFVFGIPEIRAN